MFSGVKDPAFYRSVTPELVAENGKADLIYLRASGPFSLRHATDRLIKPQLARCAEKFRQTRLVLIAIGTLQLFRHEVFTVKPCFDQHDCVRVVGATQRGRVTKVSSTFIASKTSLRRVRNSSARPGLSGMLTKIVNGLRIISILHAKDAAATA